MAMKALIFTFLALSISINGGQAFNVEHANPDQSLSLIKQLLAKATETLDHASELFRNEPDRGTSERYGTCIEEYRGATARNIPAAAADVKAGKYDAAVEDLKATAVHADNCQNQFASGSPFTDETNVVKDLVSQAISAIQ